MKKTFKKQSHIKTLKNSDKANDTIDSGNLFLRFQNNPDRYFDIFATVLLLLFGVFMSLTYFGHQEVPHFDFNCFARVGHNILNFEEPYSYKRGPMTGMLQILAGKFTNAESPDFAGAWILNSTLHPLTVVLFFLIGKRFFGKAAAFLAVILAINPWLIQLLTEAIAETPLMFFILLTFYLIFRRSNWAYLTAAVTTMVRYEGAALILIAFILDMIHLKSKKEKVRAFIYSTLASVPLAIWMIATYIDSAKMGGTHYLKELGSQGAFMQTARILVEKLWLVTIYPLTIIDVDQQKTQFFMQATKLFTFLTLLGGGVLAVIRKNYYILSLLLFLILYMLVHILHSFTYHRFCLIVFWPLVFICLYGSVTGWKMVSQKYKIPRWTIVILQLIVVFLSIAWAARIFNLMPQINLMSPVSKYIPYAAFAVILLMGLIRLCLYKAKFLLKDITIAALCAGMILSNQTMIAGVVGKGDRDIEFKYLLDWYIENAKPGEKMVLSVPVILQDLGPRYKDNFIHIAHIEGETPQQFAQNCYKENITYVAWDSRIGMAPQDRYYKSWGIRRIAMLAKPRDIGPYKYLSTVSSGKRHIHIFRLKTAEELRQTQN